MQTKLILALDTSCYTTSLSLIDTSGQIVADQRIVLRVKEGERGLRQSDAVFQHIQNLPQLLAAPLPVAEFAAVTVSTRPRPVADAYLPVFRVGASYGATFAKLIGIPVYEVSHQEGHIRAGLYGVAGWDEPFLAWHISGGTTELLTVTPNCAGYTIEKIGGSSDLQVGQFVDRVGVALGAGFPAGMALEQIAAEASTPEPLPIVTHDLNISFSGPESAAARLLHSGQYHRGALAFGVFHCIARSIAKVTERAVAIHKLNRVLLVGGVASNQIIRNELTTAGTRAGIDYHFGARQLSSDNAVGVGLLGYDYYVAN